MALLFHKDFIALRELARIAPHFGRRAAISSGHVGGVQLPPGELVKKFAFVARMLVIGFVAACVLVPIQMIESKISERQQRANNVLSQFAAETSGPQMVAGPFLALTCEEVDQVERQVMHEGKAETIREDKTMPCGIGYFPPRTFNAKATLPVETLHRGIYPIRLYRAATSLSGEVEWPGPPSQQGAIKRAWNDAYLVTFVSDPRGIKAIASSTSKDLLAPAERGLDRFSVRESLGSYADRKPGTTIAFSYDMTLAGTSSFMIAPVGDRSEIRLSSNWPHPSFGTDWSPEERTIGDSGFDARWRLTSVATGGQAMWSRLMATSTPGSAPAAGASLYDPVNVYTLSYRATEYAFLFVLFTFTALALAEVAAGIRLHAIQYALVGSAIAVFFLLLIALSEHFAFDVSYLAASAACVTLLTFYLRHPLGSWLRATTFFGIFAALYGTLYTLLQSEDNALLMGSLVTFGVLALVMVATRKVDWSGLSNRMSAAPL